jgi:AAA domain, putative AbiEii toxin, Type IV TA system
MYIKRVEFTNLRCFKHGEMDFRYPGDGVTVPDGVPNLENVNLILGVNGAGKTTALKAVALSLMAQMPSTGFVPDSLVRYEEAESNTELVTYSGEGLFPDHNYHFEAKIKKFHTTEELVSKGRYRDNIFYDDESPEYFMVAYGATRRTESGDFESSSRRKLRSERYARVAGLFEDHLALMPFGAWLSKLLLKRTKEIYSLLKKLLPNKLAFLGLDTQKQVFFEQDEILIPFQALSDGYRAYIGWITDLLYHMINVSKGKNIEILKGVVMVDEIDLHIHPSWQKIIIEQVARALPNLQFIFTTHSPIVAGSVSSQNLWIAKTAEDGSSILERPSREIYGLNADQILTSDIFGLQSTRAEGFLKELDKLEQKAIRGDEDAALALMRGMALGKGAVEPKEPPAWVKQAAKKSRKKS